jgi:uncharacterized protein DUF4112
MNPAPVETPNDSELARARALSRILDSAVGIPGTPLRIGLDAILGIIPGGGDILGAALSGYIVLIAARRGIPRPVLWRMLANVAIDTGFGAVPLIGDMFDVAWRSNTKNVDLLERHAASPRETTRRSRLLGFAVAALILLALAGLATLGFLLARAVWQLITR